MTRREYIGDTPVDIEIVNEGAPEEQTRVTLRGKSWLFDGVETAQSAYDKITEITDRAKRLLNTRL